MASRGGATRPNGPNAGNKICQFKLVLLGESAVGKSSLVLRFVKGQFHEFQESTIGGKANVHEDFFISVITVCDFNLVNFWSNLESFSSKASSWFSILCSFSKKKKLMEHSFGKWEVAQISPHINPANQYSVLRGMHASGFHLIGCGFQVSPTCLQNHRVYLLCITH